MWLHLKDQNSAFVYFRLPLNLWHPSSEFSATNREFLSCRVLYSGLVLTTARGSSTKPLTSFLTGGTKGLRGRTCALAGEPVHCPLHSQARDAYTTPGRASHTLYFTQNLSMSAQFAVKLSYGQTHRSAETVFPIVPSEGLTNSSAKKHSCQKCVRFSSEPRASTR